MIVVGVVGVVAVGRLLGTLGTLGAHGGVADRRVRRAVELAEVPVEARVRGAPAAAVKMREPVGLAPIAQVVHPGGDGVQRLVPGDRHEARVFVPALAWVGALHRSLEPVRVIEEVAAEVTLRAELAVRNRVADVTVDRVHPPVRRVDVDAAARRALAADVLGDPGLAAHGLGACLPDRGQSRQAAQAGHGCPGGTRDGAGLEKAPAVHQVLEDVHQRTLLSFGWACCICSCSGLGMGLLAKRRG